MLRQPHQGKGAAKGQVSGVQLLDLRDSKADPTGSSQLTLMRLPQPELPGQSSPDIASPPKRPVQVKCCPVRGQRDIRPRKGVRISGVA